MSKIRAKNTVVYKKNKTFHYLCPTNNPPYKHMLFNSIEFALFLPVVFLLYWLLTPRNSNAVGSTPRYSIFKYIGKNIGIDTQLRLQNLFVVVASYVFYGWWDWRFLLLIAFTSLCSWASGILIDKHKYVLGGVLSIKQLHSRLQ